ncbi:unnamed protein product, partial [Darwinula stevensoni]
MHVRNGEDKIHKECLDVIWQTIKELARKLVNALFKGYREDIPMPFIYGFKIGKHHLTFSFLKIFGHNHITFWIPHQSNVTMNDKFKLFCPTRVHSPNVSVVDEELLPIMQYPVNHLLHILFKELQLKALVQLSLLLMPLLLHFMVELMKRFQEAKNLRNACLKTVLQINCLPMELLHFKASLNPLTMMIHKTTHFEDVNTCYQWKHSNGMGREGHAFNPKQ